MGLLADIGRSNALQVGQNVFKDVLATGQQEQQGLMNASAMQNQQQQLAMAQQEHAAKMADWQDAHTVEDMSQYRKMAEAQGQGGVYKVMHDLAMPYIYKDPNTGNELILKKDRMKVADTLTKDPHYMFKAGTAMIESLQSKSDEFSNKFDSLKKKLSENPDATLEEQQKWSADAQAAYDAKKQVDAQITQKRTALYWADPEFAKVMLASQSKEQKLREIDVGGKSMLVPESAAVGKSAYHPVTKDSDITLREKALAGDTKSQAILDSQLRDKIKLAEAGRAVFSNMPTTTPGISFERKTGRYFTTDTTGNKKYLTSEETKNERLKFIEDQPAANIKMMKQSAPHVLDLVNASDAVINKVSNDMGPIKGRFNEFMTGKIGTTNQDWISLRTNIKLLETRLMQMHVGARGGEYILKHFQDIFSYGYQSPENMKQALADVRSYANEVKKSAFVGSSSPNETSGSSPKTAQQLIDMINSGKQ